MPDNTPYYVRARLRNDVFYDEIVLTGPSTHIACRTFPYWKSSHISGSAWRIFADWVRVDEARVIESLTGGHNIEGAAAMLGVDLVDCAKSFGDEIIESIGFVQKGVELYREELKAPTELRVAAGQIAGFRELSRWLADFSKRPTGLCDQPGCRETATVAYRQLKPYTRCGHTYERRSEAWGWVYVRSFCNRHKDRGDCNLDDANDNYEEIELTEEVQRAHVWHRPKGFNAETREGPAMITSEELGRRWVEARAR